MEAVGVESGGNLLIVRYLKILGDPLVVFLVGANPVPNKKIIQKGAHGAVVRTNPDTPLVRPHFLKP